MIGQAFVFAQPVDVLRLLGSGNHVESKKGYSPKESAFVFQKKKTHKKREVPGRQKQTVQHLQNHVLNFKGFAGILKLSRPPLSHVIVSGDQVLLLTGHATYIPSGPKSLSWGSFPDSQAWSRKAPAAPGFLSCCPHLWIVRVW